MSTALSPSFDELTRRKCPQVSSLALTSVASFPSALHLTNCAPDCELRALLVGNGTVSIVASCFFVGSMVSGTARPGPSSHCSLVLCIRPTGRVRSVRNDLKNRRNIEAKKSVNHPPLLSAIYTTVATDTRGYS